MESHRKLIYPATPEQELYRKFCEGVLIGERGYIAYTSDNLSPQLVFGSDTYPEAFESLQRNCREVFRDRLKLYFYNQGANNLCFTNNPKKHAHPAIRMWRGDGCAEILATDVITTGAGVVRPHRSYVRSLFERVLYETCDDGTGPDLYPRLVPMVQSKQASSWPHLIQYEQEIGQRPELVSTQYDSTNLIYGDVYGELLQVFARRDEGLFLERYLNHIKTTWQERMGEIIVSVINGYPTTALGRWEKIIEAFGGKVRILDSQSAGIDAFDESPDHTRLIFRANPLINYRKSDLDTCGFASLFTMPCFSDIGFRPRGFLLYAQHMHDYGIWRRPPESTRELVERVEYLLSMIEVDTKAFYK